ncbi:hypothetical protein ACQRIU_004350 [Beauveria bassiana]
MSSEKPASYGTNHLDPPALRIASSPLGMLFERVALIPLAIYLAQAGTSHPLVGRMAFVGRMALAGTIPASLFPRLGVLGGIASLLRKGAADYLDRASSVSELHRTVRDAGWGSVFPCANGAASDILTQHAVRTAVDIPIPTDLGELVPKYINQEIQAAEQSKNRGAAVIASEVKSAVEDGARGPGVRRPQTLYIIDCTIDEKRRQAHAFRASPQAAMWETVVEAAVLLALVGTTAIVILLGLYGTAAALLVSTIFRVSCLLIQVERPQGYLTSNEPDQNDACMLVEIHENANTWYLYTGSRGVVDWLLNKSMISKVTSRGGGYDTNAATAETTALLLHTLAVLQLGSMTYVATQKGWDAFGLLAIVLCASLLDHVLYSDGRLAQRWLRAEHVEMKAYACQFSGRVPMIGVIQTRRKGAATSGSPTSWMDQIIAPSERRDVWLRKLRRSASASSFTAEAAAATGQTEQRPFWVAEDGQATTEKEKNDRIWVQNNFVLTRAAAEAIDTHMGG